MRSRTLSCLLAPAVLVLALGPAYGQRLEDGQSRLTKAAGASKVLIASLQRGDVTADPANKEHQEAIDLVVRGLVYPLVWSSDVRPLAGGTYNGQVLAFDKALADLKRYGERTTAAMHLFARSSIDRTQEVIQKGKPIAGLNAAIMLNHLVERRTVRGVPISEKEWIDEVLPRLTEGNAEHLAAALLALHEDPQVKGVVVKNKAGILDRKKPGNEGIQYYLYCCMSNLMSVPAKDPLLKKETVDKLVGAALEQVEKKPGFLRNTPREEVDGFRALRREALKVVARTQNLTVGDKGKPAVALARIAAADERIVPGPRIDERVEAAVGLARLMGRAAKLPDLQADYAAAAFARAVYAFGLEANANIEEKSVLKRSRPWKVDAARLLEALDLMKGEGKDRFVNDMVKHCQDVVAPMEKGDTGRKVPDLGDWLARNAPPSKSLLKSDPESTVKPAAGLES